jgi:MFS family permease
MQCDENNNYNFTTEVLCDETITGQGNPVLKKVD